MDGLLAIKGIFLCFVILGVSADPETSHQKFKEKYYLSVPLFSDAYKSNKCL
jgi:peroxiredoxin